MSDSRRLSTMVAMLLGMALPVTPDLVLAADLAGIVRTSTGSPAGAGWRVVVQGLDTPGATLALTDKQGSFHLAGLGDGRSTVVVHAPSGRPAGSGPLAGRLVQLSGERVTRIDLTLNPVDSAAPTFNFTFYRGEYWNDQPSELLATGVQLPEQGSVGNINMELAAGGGTISGRVIRDAGGAGVAGLIVAAFGYDTSVFSFDRTDADGYYRITGIPADGFLVTAGLAFADPNGDIVGEYYNNSLTTGTSSIVPVTEGADTPDIDFSLGAAGAVAGHVSAESNGEGLANILVTAYETTLDLQYLALSDSTGNFVLNRLPPGSWKVGASSSDNYVGEFWNNKESFETADVILVSAGPPAGGINLALATGGTITGIITHQTGGQPLVDLIVLAERLGDQLTRTARTDSMGIYHVLGLPTGTYHVYVPEIGKYWNNRGGPGTADPVEVSLGAVTSGIDFQGFPLDTNCPSNPEDVALIRGAVFDQELQPVQSARVGLNVDILGTLLQVDEAITDENGAFEFACVQPGNYFIDCRVPFSSFVREWYDDKSEARPDTVRAVAGQVTDGIDFLLVFGGSIGGRVTAVGDAGLSGIEVIALNRSTGETASELTGADGTYLIGGGQQGGLTGGTYTVWTEGRSTADPSLVPVALARWTASASPDGGVVLEWTTSHEAHHAGFHVERASTPNATPVRLTSELLRDGPDYRFLDIAAPEGDNWYWLLAVDRQGRTERFGPVTISVGPVIGSRLLGPAVNPTVGNASIRWEMGREGPVQLRIFDAAGRWVRTLVDDVRPAGAGAAHWDGRSADGRPVAGGLYFLRFDTRDGTESGRLMLIR